MVYRPAPDHREPIQVEWHGAYPTLSAITLAGGVPGLRYHLVHSANTGQAQSLGWKLVAGMPVFIVHGPKGIASAMLLCDGDPIPGASALGSKRPYDIDPRLDRETGLGGSHAETPSVVEDRPRKGAEGAAAR